MAEPSSLEQRLAEAEATLDALRGGEVDAVVGREHLMLLRLREAEAGLRESEERFRALADNMSQLAWLANERGWTFWYNRRWYDYTGTTLEEMRGWGWRKVHHPDHVDRVVRGIEQAWDTGEGWEDTFPLRGKEGSYRWFLSRVVPIRDERDCVTRWVGTHTDVTEQRAAEAALKQADRRKDEFLAMLAHELRNPLAPLQNGLELLRLAKPDSPTGLEARAMMERQMAQLVRLIDDLLDISRIASSKLELKQQPMDIAQAVRSALETSRPLLDTARHEVRVDLPGPPLIVEADPLRLAQVFANLLNNAARYTPAHGHISISARTEGDDVVVVVEDDGSGIPEEMLERVFEPFQQVDTAATRAASGLGLGLALARRLVELHRGAIYAESEGAGRGSRFTVRLPAAIGATLDLSAPPGEERVSRGLRVLVVDDNEDAAQSLGMLMEATGHHVRVANDGESALAGAASYKPEIVILDIGMPGMDGYEVARRLRLSPDSRNMIIIALSGYGQDADRRKSAQAGFDAHLVKPVDAAALEAVMATIRHGQTAS